MWDMLRYLGFSILAVGILGAPHKRYELDNDSEYNSGQFDVIYDERQNGTENYKLSIDGLSLIWSPNSLLAAAALLEPALYGEYPDTNVDIILGPDPPKPDEKPLVKPETEKEKPLENKPDKPAEKPLENSEVPAPTLLVIDGNQLTPQKANVLENTVGGSKRKLRLPGIIRPFLRKRSSAASSKSSQAIS